MVSKPKMRRMARPSAKTKKSTRAKDGDAREATSSRASKIDQIIAALRMREGATLTQLMTLTGWQAHSVRAALSGTLKKARGLTITSKRVDAERVYRIEGGR
jgi:hypothetical protein